LSHLLKISVKRLWKQSAGVNDSPHLNNGPSGISPCIYVIAGTNGAGKSSILGQALSRRGVSAFNPDDAAKKFLTADPSISVEQANSRAWSEGVRLLKSAIENRLDFAFETTLGGRTIAELLESATSTGIDLRIWYVALASVQLHINRVEARVRRGGHDIPHAAIHYRYDQSRLNLIRLLPVLRELWLYDNSFEADPYTGVAPQPRLIVHFKEKRIVTACALPETPDWAKPIVVECFRISPQRS
jgi:predicted ABC-type ATPase